MAGYQEVPFTDTSLQDIVCTSTFWGQGVGRKGRGKIAISVKKSGPPFFWMAQVVSSAEIAGPIL